MAPEQAEGLEAGAPADLYSTALVIYEALTGINPVGTGTAARRARRLGAYLPPVRRQRRDLPRELGYAVDLALRPRPRERGSVEELREALETSVDAVHDRPGVVGSPWPAPTLGRKTARRWEQDGPWDERGDPAPVGTPAFDQAEEVAGASRPSIPWPQRALAAAVAAVTAGWLVGEVLAPSALPPAAAALLAGVAVAALPRVGWAAVIVAASAGLAAQGRTGASVVLVAAGLIPALLLPLRPARWPLGALAPTLGAVGLAGAWPAVAGRAGGAWQRAALGASGWILLVAAETLVSTDLYVRLPHAIAARSAWMPSAYDTLHHVIGPLVSAGVLAPALVWGVAAAVLPCTTVMGPLRVQIVLVTMWTAATASATTALLHAGRGGALVEPGAAVLGAVAAGLVALAPSLAGRIRRWRRAGNTPIGLA